jgi:murein DD-endopeptidase MepM/ murein hydrolase activator NlpD
MARSAVVGDTPVIEAPLSGECLVLRPPGHSDWAFDILPLPSGSGDDRRLVWRYLAGRLHASDLAAWGRPVRSPISGQVSVLHDAEPDLDHLLPWRDVPAGLLIRPVLKGRCLATMAGNHVVVGGASTFVLLAHLKRGSVVTTRDAHVALSGPIAAVGASGNALAPHLHLQVMTGPDPLANRPSPFVLRRYEVWDGRDWRERLGSPLPRARTARIRFP